MKIEDFRFGNGKVVFWDLDSISVGIPIKEQLDELKEDLAQIHFPSGVIIDVGWYPEFSMAGSFVVNVVRENEWDDPIFKMECPSTEGLISALDQAVSVAMK